MTEAVSVSKDPAKVRAGQMGARERWHAPKVVNLADLTGAQRRLVLALVDAARKEKTAGGEAAPQAAREKEARHGPGLAA
jgi:hypothetical protein